MPSVSFGLVLVLLVCAGHAAFAGLLSLGAVLVLTAIELTVFLWRVIRFRILWNRTLTLLEPVAIDDEATQHDPRTATR